MINYNFMKTIYIYFNITYKYLYFSLKKPSIEYKFPTIQLESNLELTNIFSEISGLLPQYSNFISQFNSFISINDVNVVSDASGNLSIDVPNSMNNVDSELVRKKIGIFDSLIRTHGDSLQDLFRRAESIQQQTPDSNSQFKSQIAEKLVEYNRLKSSYRH